VFIERLKIDMKVIPSIIYDPKSDAEVKVFDLLKKTSFGDGAVAVHSLNVPEHEYKRWSELDFVILSPYGIFVLEVKGGGVSVDDNGIWTFTNRFGREHRKSEGPFQQVSSGMFAFEKMLEKKFPGQYSRKVCFGWGVILTDAPFDAESIEIPKETVLDDREFKKLSNLNRYLERLSDYWRGKTGLGKYSDYTIGSTFKYLRPKFDLVPTLSSRIEMISSKQVSLTEEQYTYLDNIQEAERIICEGGAGTGKSFMAAEVARSEEFCGNKVLFLCKSPIFSCYVGSRLNSENIDVFDLKTLEKMIARETERSQYDVLIVDEGQDLLDFSNFDTMNTVFRGGLEGGRWRFFMDYNNQSAITGLEGKAEAYQWLKSCQATPLKLKRNCRNTVQIVQQTKMTTGADIGLSIIDGEGPKITFVYPENERETARKLSAQLTEWVDGLDIPLGQITILSTKTVRESCARYLSSRWLSIIKTIGVSVVEDWGNSLTFSKIEDFKGLENKCIAIIDLDGFDGGARTVSELYVGMTRANALLWLAIPASVREQFDLLRVENAKKLVSEAQGEKNAFR